MQGALAGPRLLRAALGCVRHTLTPSCRDVQAPVNGPSGVEGITHLVPGPNPDSDPWQALDALTAIAPIRRRIATQMHNLIAYEGDGQCSLQAQGAGQTFINENLIQTFSSKFEG
jgi:hypothetical protein